MSGGPKRNLWKTEICDNSTKKKEMKAFFHMSQKNPECPLYNPLNCKEYNNPKLCAFARKDRLCMKKKKPKPEKCPEALEST